MQFNVIVSFATVIHGDSDIVFTPAGWAGSDGLYPG